MQIDTTGPGHHAECQTAAGSTYKSLPTQLRDAANQCFSIASQRTTKWGDGSILKGIAEVAREAADQLEQPKTIGVTTPDAERMALDLESIDSTTDGCAAADMIRAQAAEIARLRKLVKAAYSEGFRDGLDRGQGGSARGGETAHWARSDTRYSLDRPEA